MRDVSATVVNGLLLSLKRQITRRVMVCVSAPSDEPQVERRKSGCADVSHGMLKCIVPLVVSFLIVYYESVKTGSRLPCNIWVDVIMEILSLRC